MAKHQSIVDLKALIALLLLTAAPLVWAAPGFTDWAAPANLGTSINSTYNDLGPALSKDGLSLYFTSDRPGGVGGNDIWVAQRDSLDDPWGDPVNLGPPVNTAFNEAVPSFSRDGHVMFFNSNRPGGFGGSDIWMTWRSHKRDDFAWRDPVNAGSGVNTVAQDAAATYLETDEGGIPLLYFASNRGGGPGQFDIYVSAQAADGSWGPAFVVPELSSAHSEQRPAVRTDGFELFLYSNRPGTSGPADIWVSTRESNADTWSVPITVGAEVNSAFNDVQAFVSSDRKVLLFASDRPGGFGAFDLYVSVRSIIHARE